MTQPPYLTDPLTLEFEARLLRKSSLAGGQVDVILETTYFYPTGGGQPHDTGTVGQSQVVDVFKDDEGQIVHRLDRDPGGPVVAARIDGDCRLGHMQHHSAQHILSRSLEELLQLETLSAKISLDSPSTVDVPDVVLARSDLQRVERLANRIVFENRAIRSYFISDDRIETVPFRRPPKVSGQIRVVEVVGFDYSACGGTHCPQTGMIGLITVVKSERKNQKRRLHFVAGHQALASFQQYRNIISGIGQALNTGPEELVDQVRRQTEQYQIAQQELKSLRTDLLALEAEKLVAEAEPIEGGRLATRLFRDRSVAELRELGKQLQAQDDLVAILAGYDGQKLGLVVSCGDDTGRNARTLLDHHMARIGGKGGGDHRLAQGGGPASEKQAEQLFVNTRDYV